MLERLGTMKEIGNEKELETKRETVINDDTAKKDELTGEPGKVLAMKCRLLIELKSLCCIFSLFPFEAFWRLKISHN